MTFKEIEYHQSGVSEPTIDQFKITYEFTLEASNIIEGAYTVNVYNSYGESTNVDIYLGDDINVNFTDLFFICQDHGIIPTSQVSEDNDKITVALNLVNCYAGEVITLCTGYDLAEAGKWFDEIPWNPHTSDIRPKITVLSPSGNQADINDSYPIKCRNDTTGTVSTWKWFIYLNSTDNLVASFDAVDAITYSPTDPGTYTVVLAVWDLKNNYAQDAASIVYTSIDDFYVTLSIDYPTAVTYGGITKYICKLGETARCHATAPADITSCKWIVQRVNDNGTYTVVKIVNSATLSFTYTATDEGSYQIKFIAYKGSTSRTRSAIIEFRKNKFELYLDFIILKPKLNTELVIRDALKCQNISNETLVSMRWEVLSDTTILYTQSIPDGQTFGDILEYTPESIGTYTVKLYGTDIAGIEGTKTKSISVGYPPLVAKFDISSHAAYTVQASPSRDVYDVYYLNPSDPNYDATSDPTIIICDQTCDCFPESFEWKVVERAFGSSNRIYNAIGPGLEYTVETTTESIIDIYMRVKRGTDYSAWTRKRCYVYVDRNTKATSGRGKSLIFDVILSKPLQGDETQITKIPIAGKIGIFPYSPGTQCTASSPSGLLALITAVSPCMKVEISNTETFNSGSIVYTKTITAPLTDTFSYQPTAVGSYAIRLTVINTAITGWYYNQYADTVINGVAIPTLSGDITVVYPQSATYGLVGCEDLMCVNESEDCDTITWTIKTQDNITHSMIEFTGSDVLYLPSCKPLQALQVHNATWLVTVALSKTYESGYTASITSSETITWKDLKTCNYTWSWVNPTDLKATNVRWVVGVYPQDAISLQASIPNTLPYECTFKYEWNVYWATLPAGKHLSVMTGYVNTAGSLLYTPDTYGHYLIDLRVYVYDINGNQIGHSYALTDEFICQIYYLYPYHYMKISGSVINQTSASRADMYLQINNQSFLTYVINDTSKFYKLGWAYTYASDANGVIRSSDAIYVALQNEQYSNQWNINFIDVGYYTVSLTLYEAIPNDGGSGYGYDLISKYTVVIDATPVKLVDGINTVRLLSLEVPYEGYPSLTDPLTYTEHIEGVDASNTDYALGHFVNDRLYPLIYPYLTTKNGSSTPTTNQSIPGVTMIWHVSLDDEMYVSSGETDPNGNIRQTDGSKSSMLLYAPSAHQNDSTLYFRFNYPRLIGRNLSYKGTIWVQVIDKRYGYTTTSSLTEDIKIVVTTDTYFGSSKILFNSYFLHNLYGNQSYLYRMLLKPKVINYCFNEGPYNTSNEAWTGVKLESLHMYEGRPNSLLVKYNQGPKYANIGLNMYYTITVNLYTNVGLKKSTTSSKDTCVTGKNLKIDVVTINDIGIDGTEDNAYITITITYYYNDIQTQAYTSPRYAVKKVTTMTGLYDVSTVDTTSFYYAPYDAALYNLHTPCFYGILGTKTPTGKQIDTWVMSYSMNETGQNTSVYDGLKLNTHYDPVIINTTLNPSIRCNASLYIPNYVSFLYLNGNDDRAKYVEWMIRNGSDPYINRLSRLSTHTGQQEHRYNLSISGGQDYRTFSTLALYPANSKINNASAANWYTNWFYYYDKASIDYVYRYNMNDTHTYYFHGAIYESGTSASTKYSLTDSQIEDNAVVYPLIYMDGSRMRSCGGSDNTDNLGTLSHTFTNTTITPSLYNTDIILGCLLLANNYQLYGITGSAVIMDSFRLSTTARYTDTFTVTSTPFIADTTTLVLLQFNASLDDESSYDWNVTSFTTPLYSTGKFSNAFTFTSNNYITIHNDSSLSYIGGDFTIEFFVKVTDTDTHYIYTHNSSSSMSNNMIILENGNVRWTLNDATKTLISISASMTTGIWSHIACVCSGTTYTIYVNGIIGATASLSSTTTAATVSLSTRSDADWRQMISLPKFNLGFNTDKGFISGKGETLEVVQYNPNLYADNGTVEISYKGYEVSTRSSKLPFYIYNYNSTITKNNISVESVNAAVKINNPVSQKYTYIGTQGDGWYLGASIDTATLFDYIGGKYLSFSDISAFQWSVSVDGSTLLTGSKNTTSSQIKKPFIFKSSAADGQHFYEITLTMYDAYGSSYQPVTFAFKAYHVTDYASLTDEEGDPEADDILIDPNTSIYADFDSGRGVHLATTYEDAASNTKYPLYQTYTKPNGQVVEANVNYVRFYLNPFIEVGKIGSLSVSNIVTTITDNKGVVEATLPLKYFIRDEQSPYGEFSYYVQMPNVISIVNNYLCTEFDLNIYHDNGTTEIIHYSGILYMSFTQNNPVSVTDPYTNALTYTDLTTENSYKLTIKGYTYSYTYDGISESMTIPSIEVYVSSPDSDIEFSQNEYGLDVASIKYSMVKPKDITVLARVIKDCDSDSTNNTSTHFYQTSQWGIVIWTGSDAIPDESGISTAQKAIKPFIQGYGLYCTKCGKLTNFTCSYNKIMIPTTDLYKNESIDVTYAASITLKYPNICYEDQFTTATNSAKILPIYVGLINSSQFQVADGNFAGLIGTRIIDSSNNIINTFTQQMGKSITLTDTNQQTYKSDPNYLLKVDFETVSMTKSITN